MKYQYIPQNTPLNLINKQSYWHEFLLTKCDRKVNDLNDEIHSINKTGKFEFQITSGINIHRNETYSRLLYFLSTLSTFSPTNAHFKLYVGIYHIYQASNKLIARTTDIN